MLEKERQEKDGWTEERCDCGRDCRKMEENDICIGDDNVIKHINC